MHLIRPWSTHGTTVVARACAFVLLALLATAAAVRADVQSIDGTEAPIVRVNVREGNVTIRTWDRPSVQIDADPSLQIIRRHSPGEASNYSLPIPSAQIKTADGPLDLPAESFLATLAPGRHEAIIVRDYVGSTGTGPTPVTITVPADSAFVFARTGNGTIDAADYRGGTFVGFIGRGRIQLNNMGGTVFTQVNRGPTIVTDSTFDRYRARSLAGNIAFERCNVRQIEATSVNGSIVYDAGTFEPGLARFESARGDIAIGTSGPTQLGGHTAGDGRVYTNFQHVAHIDDSHDGEANVLVSGGGPVVTAVSQAGNVFFYDGSLRARQGLAGPWQAALGTLQRPGVAARREPAFPSQEPPPLFRQRFPDYPRQGVPHYNYVSPPRPRLAARYVPRYAPRYVTPRYARQQGKPR